MRFRRKTLPVERIDEASSEPRETVEPERERDSGCEASGAASPDPIGLVAPEWSLQRSARGAALWRHAGAMTVSAGEAIEVIALDRAAHGRRFAFRDEWNVPAPGARFRVRRVAAGDRAIGFDDLDRARLEGAVLDWVRARRPRLVHVVDLEGFGPGVLIALQAAEVPTVVTLARVDELRQASERNEASELVRAALSSVERIVVRSAADASVAEAAGAPRARIRVMKPGAEGETAILRAYASLYRMLAPARETETAAAAS